MTVVSGIYTYWAFSTALDSILGSMGGLDIPDVSRPRGKITWHNGLAWHEHIV